MSRSRSAGLLRLLASLLLLACASRACAADGSAGLEGYRAHLAQLQQAVAGCNKARTPAVCNESLVGPDDEVTWGGSRRAIRYDWLRALLARAARPDAASTPAGGQPTAAHDRVTVETQLDQAQKRLAADLAQTQAAPAAAPAAYGQERAALNVILAGRAYKGVEQTTTRERFLNWFQDWLNRLLGRLIAFGMRSPWIGGVLKLLFLAAVCLGLAWMLVRIERRSRIRLTADPEQAAAAPAMRDWQLWLDDARQMAARDAWREAIHFLYWAAIARLEQRRAWAPDRARTPREYVRMVPGDDPRRAPLAALTRSFERTWYGNREAGAQDYEAALRLAEELEVK